MKTSICLARIEGQLAIWTGESAALSVVADSAGKHEKLEVSAMVWTKVPEPGDLDAAIKRAIGHADRSVGLPDTETVPE